MGRALGVTKIFELEAIAVTRTRFESTRSRYNSMLMYLDPCACSKATNCDVAKL